MSIVSERLLNRRNFIRIGGGAGTAALCRLGQASAQSTEVIVGKNGWLFPTFDQVSHTDYTRLREGISLITDAVRILEQGGIKTIICLTPAKSRIYLDELPQGVGFTADTLHRYEFEVDELRNSGTAVPDISNEMNRLRSSEPTKQLFFKGDTHWTPDGAACAASAVAEIARSKNILPPHTGPVVRLGDPREMMQTKNDLAAMLPPDQRSKYPLEPYKLLEMTASDDGDLLTKERTQVALVGNSYCHPSWGFSALLSQSLNTPVWLVWKVHSFSPFYNLLDYLNTTNFKEERPKLLVWVFHETDLATPPNNVGVWGQSAMKRETILDDLRQRLAV